MDIDCDSDQEGQQDAQEDPEDGHDEQNPEQPERALMTRPEHRVAVMEGRAVQHA